MGDFSSFPSSGSPVLRRAGSAVRINRNVSVDRNGAIPGNSQGRLVTLKEFNFLGINNSAGSILGSPTIDGVTFVAFAGGSGGAVDAVAGGIRVTSPTTASQEAGIYTMTGALQSVIGDDRWRRGRIGFWTKINSWNFPAGTVFWYAPLIDFDYADAGFYNRRSRNSQATNNDATGGWVAGCWYAGSENGTVQAGGVGASEDVGLLYFRSPWECEHYRGTWNNVTGWPLMEDMTWGGISRLYSGVITRYDATLARSKLNTLANMRFAPMSGGQAANNAFTITCERARITSWD
jgi:hypothetical protein